MKTSRGCMMLCCVIFIMTAAVFLFASSSSAQARPRYYGYGYSGCGSSYYYGNYNWRGPYRGYRYSPHAYFRYPSCYGYGYYYSPLFMPRYYFWPKYDHANPYFYSGNYLARTPFITPSMNYRMGGNVNIKVQLVLPATHLTSGGGGGYRVKVTVETNE